MFQSILLGFARLAAAGISSWLLSLGLATDGSTTEMLSGSIGLVLTGIWSAIDKKIQATKLKKAVAAPAGMAE